MSKDLRISDEEKISLKFNLFLGLVATSVFFNFNFNLQLNVIFIDFKEQQSTIFKNLKFKTSSISKENIFTLVFLIPKYKDLFDLSQNMYY